MECSFDNLLEELMERGNFKSGGLLNGDTGRFGDILPTKIEIVLLFVIDQEACI